MTSPVRHLVLYGSLQRGLPGHEQLRLGARLRFVRPVSFPGRLYDLGDYPCALLGGGRVHGELYEILDDAVLPDLDAFELCRPGEPAPFDPATGQGSLYLREEIDIQGETAFVYVFNVAPGQAPSGPPIASGRWRPGN
jgi:gamma-glutamylcyclotransferase (GGCT)/AIG2-like uncharacterized protein YtfP